ncbi:fibronectin type III domain-containing protein [uncultured Winogradskyella sp.]|uniref:fibronectin type III domain-containing protein n=1 Tax=uncultured Winogradskyella sp. TaxID=395353 RepID=UPI00260E270F|nr:fibronectin type III domain-containing protein [uncultured Winogradskyella sp.]
MKKSLFYLFLLLLTFNCSSEGDDPQGSNCTSPSNVAISNVLENTATLTWSNSNDNSNFQIEYGTSGFNQGQGNIITINGTSQNLPNLSANTSYEVYMRSSCDGSDFSSWVGPLSFTTPNINCPLPAVPNVYNVTGDSAYLEWFVDDDENSSIIASFDIEYGIAGFNLGTGTSMTTSNYSYELSNLSPTTQYDFYVKSNCSSDISSDFVGPTTFTTEASCVTPNNLDFYELESCSFRIGWSSNNETAWEIEYGEVGFAIGNGTVINTSETNFVLTENIVPNTTYEVYVRANCGSDGYSEYTDALVVTTNQLNSNFVGDWTIVMYDYYGDGWQGNGIKITVNDSVSYATIPDASGQTNQTTGTQTVNVPSNTTVLIFEFTGDTYPEEVGYEIFAPNGSLIDSGTNPPVGVLLSLEDICN